MGISKGGFSLLCELKKDYPDFGGKILQLGRQTTFVTANQVLTVTKKFGIQPCMTLNLNDTSPVGDIALFKSLGFNFVESLDLSDYENATHIGDLNQPISENLHGEYNAIFDGGTLEHVFNFPESMKNIYKMLKVGGVIVHASPSNNHVDHGFYMFSPTVFYDYYSANGFEILKSYIFEYEIDHNNKPWLIYDYKPGLIDDLSFGGWGDKKLLGIWFVARKLEMSTCDIIPQQGMYVRKWSYLKTIQGSPSETEIAQVNIEKSIVVEVQNSGKELESGMGYPKTNKIGNLKDFIKKRKYLYFVLLPLVNVLRIIKILPSRLVNALRILPSQLVNALRSIDKRVRPYRYRKPPIIARY